MPDLDPEIWENRTLGAVTTNENLERITRQDLENRAANIEDREPREIVAENTYPGWSPEVHDRTGTVQSNYMPVHFADEQPNDVIQADSDMKPEGMSDDEWNGQQANSGETVESRDESPNETEFSQDETPAESPVITADESESSEPNSTEETKWQ